MFSEQKKVDLGFYSTKLVGNRVTLSFCKKSIFNSKILSHGKVGNSVSLISWCHFTNRLFWFQQGLDILLMGIAHEIHPLNCLSVTVHCSVRYSGWCKVPCQPADLLGSPQNPLWHLFFLPRITCILSSLLMCLSVWTLGWNQFFFSTRFQLHQICLSCYQHCRNGFERLKIMRFCLRMVWLAPTQPYQDGYH